MNAVVDTSAFVSLAVGGVLQPVTTEFTVITTETVVTELEETGEFDDRHGRAAASVLELRAGFEILDVTAHEHRSSRIDDGEASCVAALGETDASFLVTDDFRALPELESLVDAEVVLSPVVLLALVKRGVLARSDARDCLDRMAEERDWLGTPLYGYAQELFGE